MWRNSDITLADLPVAIGDRALIGSFNLDLVDLSTGVSSVRIEPETLRTVAPGNRIAGSGIDELSLVRVPS